MTEQYNWTEEEVNNLKEGDELECTSSESMYFIEGTVYPVYSTTKNTVRVLDEEADETETYSISKSSLIDRNGRIDISLLGFKPVTVTPRKEIKKSSITSRKKLAKAVRQAESVLLSIIEEAKDVGMVVGNIPSATTISYQSPKEEY